MAAIGKFKAVNWGDLNTGKVVHWGIMYRPAGKRRWIPCAARSKPLFFDLEYDACGMALALNEEEAERVAS